MPTPDRNTKDKRASSLFIETRKISYTGGGTVGSRSLMITLPKQFSRVLGLKHGGIVSIQLKHFQSSEPYLIVKKVNLHDEGRE